jgi:hypothetical protein
MNALVQFLASMPGRVTRIVVGAALVLWGLMGLEATTGIVVMVIGLIPLLAGIFDVCLVAPLFGAPLSGAKIRSRK